MKDRDFIFKGGFKFLLVKYGVNSTKYLISQNLIFIFMIFLGLILLFAVRSSYMESELSIVLLTILLGLGGGWFLSFNLFHHLGFNRNLFLQDMFPMELTFTTIPTIVSIINKNMRWIYFFWLTILIFVNYMYTYNYSNFYLFMLKYVLFVAMWVMMNFLIVLYCYYKKNV